MAKFNAKQRKAFTQELQNHALICKVNMDCPDSLNEDLAHKSIMEVIKLSRVLNEEISIHEFIVMTKDKTLRKYYQSLVDLHKSPSDYKRVGFGPDHGKYSSKNRKPC